MEQRINKRCVDSEYRIEGMREGIDTPPRLSGISLAVEAPWAARLGYL
jgi:hypothetical protein